MAVSQPALLPSAPSAGGAEICFCFQGFFRNRRVESLPPAVAGLETTMTSLL